MTACCNPFGLAGAALFLGMILFCMAMCLGGFMRARRNGKSGWCRGSGAGGRDDEG